MYIESSHQIHKHTHTHTPTHTHPYTRAQAQRGDNYRRSLSRVIAVARLLGCSVARSRGGAIARSLRRSVVRSLPWERISDIRTILAEYPHILLYIESDGLRCQYTRTTSTMRIARSLGWWGYAARKELHCYFSMKLRLESVLERLVLKKYAECTSQHVKWTSGA